jgi:endonuclease/exonuclease/phosphatase family metal-dependent hydrolase
MNKIVVFTIAALFAGGCAERGIVENSALQTAGPNAAVVASPEASGLTVMTWNVYYGTDPNIVLQAQTFEELAYYAGQAWGLAQFTNFPERAGALARAIALQKPHLVGVQEAALWRTGAFLTPPAENVAFDFLALLTDSLHARGLDYIVAAADQTTDIEVPAINPNTGMLLDVRLTDRDAVLVRTDVPYTEAASAPYNTNFQVPVIGMTVAIKEGWSSVVATVGGRDYRFVSTHLEVQQALPVQAGQAHELITVLSGETRPTIVVGDFNSDVYGKDPSAAGVSYDSMTAAGFTDSWLRPGGAPPGLSCCQNDSVSNKLSTFDQRVDFIFTRNMPTSVPAGSLVLARSVVGDQRGDRTPFGLWPSDHAGVVATFLTPPVGPRGNGVAE